MSYILLLCWIDYEYSKYKKEVIMENSLEKINREMGAKLRGEFGTRRGNEIIRSMAEAKDGCKYPLWSRD